MAHIVAIPLPLPGHESALLQVCRIISCFSNNTITFLTTTQQEHHQSLDGIRFAFLELPTNEEVPSTQTWKLFRDFHSTIDKMQEAAHHFLTSSSAHLPIDILLTDALLGWAHDLAAQLGIPKIAFCNSNASECQVYHCVPSLIARSILPFKVPSGRALEDPDLLLEGWSHVDCPTFHRVAPGSKDDILVDIPGMSPLRRSEFPSLLQIEDKEDIVFHGFVKQFSRLVEGDFLLLNTFYEVEGPAIEELKREMKGPVVPVGPLFLMDERHEYNTKETKEEGRECLRWLDLHPQGSVVYVAFGTMMWLSNSQIGEIAAGLEACKQPFLWSLREGCDHLPEGFLERCKDRGKVVSWVPQTLILGHLSIGAHLSHSGWNSTLESLALGVPIICCPQVVDQILNAKITVELGVGVRSSLIAADLASAVKMLLHHDGEGASIRAKSRAMQHVLSNGLTGSSREGWDSLFQFIANHSPRQWQGTFGPWTMARLG